MAVVAPHGVLFRSGAEGKIREKLIRDNALDAVVGLPAQLFPTTGIPVCIMVFDRSREANGLRAHERDVLFIDASRDFEPGKKQNRLRDEDVAKIVDTYRTRTERERYSHKATFEEIEANGFNLNIPRYVDTFEPEPEVDLQAVQNEIRDLEGSARQDPREDEFLSQGARHRCLRLLPRPTARRGRTLKLYLADGTPSGVITAELGVSSVRAASLRAPLCPNSSAGKRRRERASIPWSGPTRICLGVSWSMSAKATK